MFLCEIFRPIQTLEDGLVPQSSPELGRVGTALPAPSALPLCPASILADDRAARME
jgi:hypothetical protein